ncbi:MAG TPA: peptide chain release factor N(5)-glutamine methyltransferase [Cyclobacteriaceae bacterium]|nr:peptide chain release factor N(5)-glutamine methyltransferase [Cyclobacteriaceae bacterium]
MTNSKTLFNELQSKLNLDDGDEVHAMALALMEKFYGLTWTDIVGEKQIGPQDLSLVLDRLNRHEPMQYVLGEADFYGRKFSVNPSVLIPRPETELLVREVVKAGIKAPRILDVGTGSGCIAVTLALEIPNATVLAVDISQRALDTAEANSKKWQSKVRFLLANFLTDNLPPEPVDLIVSNPPYVLEGEKALMKSNVLDYEPHQALFVRDDDPLLFYKAIAAQRGRLLAPNGRVFVETNEKFGNEVVKLFRAASFRDVTAIRDLDGKDRIVVARG